MGGAGSRLNKVRQSLERWRREFGGPGRPLPADLWDEAVAVARTEGVGETARQLRLDRARLASRMTPAESVDGNSAQAGDFVAIDARGLCVPGQTVVRLVGCDGERLEIALGATSSVDIEALARAFWTRSR